MSEIAVFCADESISGDRLDVGLSELLVDLSRSRLQKLIKEGDVTVNGEASKVSRLLKVNDVISVILPELKATALVPENIPLNIVYQDSSLAVLNKQQGLIVHPAGGAYTGTLVNALLYHIKDLSGINGDIRPGIVHRLDKDTSGLMVIAKNDIAHRSLAEQISTKTCRRIYYALVEGVMKTDSGVVEQPIGRSLSDRKKMDITADGRYAKTYYEVLNRFANNTLVKFELSTGRTHQIRVHSKFLGHPVVGDKTYGFHSQKFNLEGQLLHSKEIRFLHPVTGAEMSFDSELPDYFLRVLNSLK